MATESPQIEQLVQRGISAAREGRYGVAQQSLREAVRLAPNHEQAWLWLSGVEDTDQGKLTALQNVLRINPQNAAATRGLEHLTQPKVIDLASLLPPAPAPPPAKAGWSPPPAQAAPPVQVAPPAWSPPAPTSPPNGPLATSPLTPGKDYAAAAEPNPEEQQVNPDMVADLRPAIAKARKKRAFWPSTSEVIILVILVVLLSGAFIGARIWLQDKFPDRSNISGRFNTKNVPTNTSSNSDLEPTLEPVAQATSAPAVQTGGTFSSRSYSIQIVSASVAEDNRTTTVEVVLQNSTTRATGFRQRDFVLRTGVNARLVLDAANSSLFAGKAESELTIPPSGLASGTIVFTGDASRSPLTLIWQPFNGAVNQQITVK